MSEALRVIADDLTGACDIGAELLSLGVPVVVHHAERRASHSPGAVSVCNTASRGCDASMAAARVRTALSDLAPDWRGILVKKIDTALRGPVAAELAAAMACVGVKEAFVLPAIPSVGRITVQGVQHLDGVPLAETAFANDPLHPITESSVLAVLEREGLLEARLLGLEAVREAAWAGHWPPAQRPRAVVCDAETDADIEAALGAILRRPRPLVLAGSIGLGRALALLSAGVVGRTGPTAGVPKPRPGGVLLGVGSIHPASRTQLAAAVRVLGVETVEVPDTAAIAPAVARAVARIGRGLPVALTTPAGRSTAPSALGEHLADAVAACLRVSAPGGLVLVGGETAQWVLARLGYPRLQLEGRPVPLVVYGRLLDGPYPGLVLATKGGSAGDDEVVIRMIRCFDGGGWR
jgi:D-threonate/D-erythronate kinase